MSTPKPQDDAFLTPEEGNAIELRRAQLELRKNAYGKLAKQQGPNDSVMGHTYEDLASEAMIEFLRLRGLGASYTDALKMAKHSLSMDIIDLNKKSRNNPTTSMYHLDEDGELVEMDFPAREAAWLDWPAWYVAMLDEVLTSDERHVIDAVFVLDLTQTAIALRLGMSQATVSRLRVSALEKIQVSLSGRE
jgi:RNA polymerase sigma factor (sigma-70 family)